MRRVLVVLVLVLALYFIFSRLEDVRQIVATFRAGNALWLGLALLLQFTWLMTVALTLRAIYRLLGLNAGLAALLPLAITSNFVNVSAPSGGVGGMAVFVADARRRGRSTVRVTIAGALYLLYDYFSFLCVLALGMGVLIRRGNLTAVEVGAAGFLLAYALGLSALLVLGATSPPLFERALLWAARTVNRLVRPVLRRPYLSEGRAHAFAVETAAGLAALRTHWRGYVPPAILSLLAKAQLLAILLLVFLAFGQPLSAGTIVAGYSIGSLFAIVSPTPGGMGVVEGAMTLGLTSLRVPLGPATVITLAYRGLTFWLPFVYGFIAMRVLHLQWGQQEREVTP
jgi:uncharacterized protein (TIRG00374 family)